MRRLLALLLGIASLLAAHPVGAAPGGLPVVVSVASDAREVDPAQMRAAIGRELGTEAIDPGDPRGVTARGRIDVSIDRAARQLVVTYRGGAEPIERRVDLPSDASALSREAVLLAGNLARDEAGELVSQLRRVRVVSLPQPSVSHEDRAEIEADDLLGRTLRGHAQRDRTVRLAFGWTFLGGGLGVAGTGLYLGSTGRQPAGQDLVLYGALAAAGGVWTLAERSDFEVWSTEYDSARREGEPNQGLREDLEQRWRRRAADERFRRMGVSAALMGFGLVYGGIYAFVPAMGPVDRAGAVGLGVAVASVGVASAIVCLTTEGTMESRLHRYEHIVGRPIETSEVSLGFAPVPGGVVAGMTGRF